MARSLLRPAAQPAAVGADALGGVMKVICAWCGKVLRRRWPYDSDKISHGICGGCAGELKYSDEDLSLEVAASQEIRKEFRRIKQDES